jgi:hypothetical protein
VAAAMAYVVFLLENKSFVTAKAWAEALRTGRWKTMALLTPSWFVCMWLAIAAGVGLAVLAEVTEASGVARYLAPKAYLTGPFVIAAILFMLRDIGFLLFLNLGTRLLRPDLAGVIYLIVLYGVGGGLLSQFNYGGALAFVVPNDTGNAILTIAPVLVQAAVVWAVLAYRLRSTMRAAAPAN